MLEEEIRRTAVQMQYPLFYITKSIYKKEMPYDTLYIDKSDYYAKNNRGFGGSFLKGSFPKLLPKPDKVFGKIPVFSPLLPSSKDFYIPPSTEYRPHHSYYWQNAKKDSNLPILVLYTGYISIPMSIFFSSNSSIIDDFPNR